MAYIFVSGRPCLDLFGTRKFRRSKTVEEQLIVTGSVSDWAQSSGLVDGPVRVSPAGHGQALDLREAGYRVLTAAMHGAPARRADIAVVNAHARADPISVRLGADGRVSRRASLPQLLATLARDTLDLLAGDDMGRLRECSNPDCTRLYVDNSRSGNRRWCGMSECGNRAKIAAFRRRNKSLIASSSD